MKKSVFMYAQYFLIFLVGCKIYTQDQKNITPIVTEQKDNHSPQNDSKRADYYKILGLNSNASAEDVERSYYVRTAKNHARLNAIPCKLMYDKQAVIAVYGKEPYSTPKGYSKHFWFSQDDQVRDKVYEIQKDTKQVREAFEFITGKKLPKIKRYLKLVSSEGLSQKLLERNINYENNGTGETIIKFIEQTRAKNKLDVSCSQLDEDYFVLGEPDQLLVTLTPNDRKAAQQYNSAEQKEKVANHIKQQERNDEAQFGLYLAGAGATITLASLLYVMHYILTT